MAVSDNFDVKVHTSISWDGREYKTCILGIDCHYLIDHYEYHDAPKYIDAYLKREDVENLISKFQEALKELNGIS